MLKNIYILLFALTIVFSAHAQNEVDTTRWHLKDFTLTKVSFLKADTVISDGVTTSHMPVAIENQVDSVWVTLQFNKVLPKDSTDNDNTNVCDSLYYVIFKDGIEAFRDSIYVNRYIVKTEKTSTEKAGKWKVGEEYRDTTIIDSTITITACLPLLNTSGLYSFRAARANTNPVPAVDYVRLWDIPSFKVSTPTEVSLYDGKETSFGVTTQNDNEEVVTLLWNDDQKSTTPSISVKAQYTKEKKNEVDERTYTLEWSFGHGNQVWDSGNSNFILYTYPTPKFAYEVRVNGNIIPDPTATIYLLPLDEVEMTGTRTEGAGELSYQWSESGTSAGTNPIASFTAQNNGSSDIDMTYKVTITDKIPEDQTQDSSPEYKFVIYPAPTASFNEKTKATLYYVKEQSPLDPLKVSENCKSKDVTWIATWKRNNVVIDENENQLTYTIPTPDLQEVGTTIYTVDVQCVGSKEGFNKDKVYFHPEKMVFTVNVYPSPIISEEKPAAFNDEAHPNGDTTHSGQNVTYQLSYSGGDNDGWKVDVTGDAKLVRFDQTNQTVEVSFKDFSGATDNGATANFNIKLTNSLTAAPSETSGTTSFDKSWPLTATVFTTPSLAWDATKTPLTDYFYDSAAIWKLVPRNSNQDGWTYTWKLNGENITVNADGTYTIPEFSGADSQSVNVSVNASNKKNGEEWSSFSDSFSFTAWKNGLLNGITLIYRDNSDVYEGDLFTMRGNIEAGFPSGWTYAWTRDEDNSSVGNTQEVILRANRLTQNASESQTYTLFTDNKIGNTSGKPIPTKSQTITVWRKAENIGTDFSIIDQNRGASAEMGVREGNGLYFSTVAANYGYNNNWHYLWNGTDMTVNTLTDVAPTISQSGESKTTETKTYTLRISNIGPNGTPWEQTNEMKKTVTVYKKPKTPTSLVKKGNGASRTLIATTALSDTQLEDNEYYLVFAYNDNGDIKVISEQRQDNPGQVRWAMQVPADQYANENQLCIYALWVYPDGSRVTSGLRSFDGTVNEAWDGSDYSHSTRGGDETGIQDVMMQHDSQGNLQESYTLTGMKSSHLVKGINIVRMNDGSIRKVYKK